MDVEKVLKLLKEIDDIALQIPEERLDIRGTIDRKTKEIRAEFPKPPRTGGSFNWGAV